MPNTRLKKYMKKSSDAETLYKKLIENMNEAVWMGDENEVTVYANPKFCELMEYSLEEMIGRKSYEFWDEESARKVRDVNNTDRKRGISSSYEGNLLTKSGEKIPVLLNGTPLPDGGTIGIMTDLRELKKKETLYKKLIENMNEAVWMGDENEVTVYANPKFCELMEYSLEEMMGVESYEFWDEESAKTVRNVNNTDRKRGISSSYEGNLLTKSGEKIPVLLNGTPLPDGGTIGIMTDLRELRKRDNLYKKLIENMNEAVWMGDENEVTVYANPKFCELMEYGLEEMMGRQSYDFWDEESTKTVKNVNNTDRKDGISSSYEGNLLTKSGKKIPVLLNGTPLANGGTIGIMTDLRELKKKESLYRKLVENMNEAVWMGDENEVTVYANPKFCEMLGYGLNELVGKDAYEHWDKESRATVEKINKRKRRKGISSSYEGILIAKDGSEIPVLASGSPMTDGGTMCIITDLSEIKKKEETEKILNNAVKYSTDAIVIFNSKGEIETWNKGAKVMFGYKKEEIVGKTLHRILADEDIENILSHSQVLYNLEFKAKHKNKNKLSISATLTPIFNDDNKKVSFCLLIARDITTKTKFEEELALKYQKMREAYNKFGVIRRQMDYMFDLLKLAEKEQNFQNIADFIVCSVIMLTRVDACILRRFDESKGMMELLSSFGVGTDWQGKANIKYKGSLAEKAFEQGMPMKIIDVTKEHKYQSAYLAKKNSLCSLLLIPLISNNKLIGSLSLYSTPDKKLEIFENEFIEKYAKLVEVVVGNMV